MMMDHKLRTILVVLVICCFFFFFIVQSTATNTVKEEEEGSISMDEEKKATMIEMVKSLLSFPTAFPQTSNYWVKVKTLIKQGQPYVSPPPNLDFRKGEEADVSAVGTGEKVKQAVVKSLDKSKTTIQDSAKSAANVAGETANKVKKTLSHKAQDEL